MFYPDRWHRIQPGLYAYMRGIKVWRLESNQWIIIFSSGVERKFGTLRDCKEFLGFLIR